MGFENRKAHRVKATFDLNYWDGEARGIGSWGQGLNVSESGLAFRCPQQIPKGKIIVLEFSSAGRRRPIRVSSQVVYSEKDDTGEKRFQIRVQFVNLEAEERILIRLHVLQVSDPSRASFTGWGHVNLPDRPQADCTYREMAPDEKRSMIEKKLYFSKKEVGFLKKFQGFLELKFGSRNPDGFKLEGSKLLRNHADVWFELDLSGSRLHLLAETMWSSQEKDSKAEAGLIISAYHKEDAFALEKLT
jgi:hypothetical protein